MLCPGNGIAVVSRPKGWELMKFRTSCQSVTATSGLKYIARSLVLEVQIWAVNEADQGDRRGILGVGRSARHRTSQNIRQKVGGWVWLEEDVR